MGGWGEEGSWELGVGGWGRRELGLILTYSQTDRNSALFKNGENQGKSAIVLDPHSALSTNFPPFAHLLPHSALFSPLGTRNFALLPPLSTQHFTLST
uniref:Uncharacterized protein n=1 Tax=Desertifilum tharense IPPAS B-1220 TaxID=1781255 RepID=A0ACD5H0V3_9CYAN